MNDGIADWRKRIDEIDTEMVKLLNERAASAIEIGKLKKVSGSEIFDPKRESFIFDRIRDLNEGPLESDNMVNIFKCIIEECRSKEARSS